MKKIFTLAFMAFFCSLGMMAQVVLGDIKFSLGEGKKINPANGKIVITFPNVSGVEDPTTTTFMIEGSFTADELEPSKFDGIEGTFAEGITLELSEFELQPSTAYALNITSVKVDGTELAADTTYVLNFKTRSAERKMSWTFLMDEASAAQIIAEGSTNVDGVEGSDYTKYAELQKNGATQHRYYVPARNYEEIMLPDGSALPMTEDLTFKFGERAFYVGDTEGSYKDLIAFNGKNQYMVIPDCEVGDIITLNANRATKPDQGKGKYTSIIAMNGAASAPEGYAWADPESEIKDSIMLGSNYTNFKFEVLVAGDVTFKFCNCLMKTITIEESQEKVARNYNIVAQYQPEEGDAIVLKELVAKTEGMTGSSVKANYPYWLVDAEGNAYTHGSKGNEFVEAFELKNGEGDTIFVINYAKTDYTGVAYLSEGEDIEGSILCTSPNAAIRSSMGKAAYVMEDTKLVTLQPGSYKIRAILFDAGKSASYSCLFTKGAAEEDEIYLNATATNWTEAESDLITLDAAADITLGAGGSDNTGLDVVMIYASDDVPDDPQGITEVNAGAQKMAARKLMKEGKILIQTEAGTVNVAGQLVK